MKKIIGGLLLLCAVSSAQAQYKYRQMQLAPSAGYGFGLLGFDRMEDVYTFNLWYSYWLNDTSTLDVSASYLKSRYDVSIHREGLPRETERPSWDTWAGEVGVRYQPQWDFFLNFGFGGGVGYEGWTTTGDQIKSRSGNGLIYYLLADVEYPVRPWLSIGAYVRPQFLPLKEHLVKSLTITASGVDTENVNLSNGVIIDTGLWVTIRVY